MIYRHGPAVPFELLGTCREEIDQFGSAAGHPDNAEHCASFAVSKEG